MNRKESVAQESYISPKLDYYVLEPASLFLSLSISDVDLVPQVDEYVQEATTEIEF